MRKKGQAAIVGLMIGVMIFMLAMIFVQPIGDVINEVRGVTQLDCDNSSISDGHKGTCLIMDLTMPYFIAVVLAVGGGYVSARFIG